MKEIYRKSLIEKMSNPEQLDKAISITSAYSWIALAAVALLIAAVVVWSVVGTLPDTLTAAGVITSSDSVGAVFSDTAGVVKQVHIKGGEKFSAGDKLVTVEDGTGKTVDITADESGTATHILVTDFDTAAEGAYVLPGQEVIRFTPDIDVDSVVVCYVPIVQAQQLKSGMTAQVTPASSGSQQLHMQGEIISVSSHAANVSYVGYVLGTSDNQLAGALIGGEPVAQVVIKLKKDSTSENGYYWTNEKGKSVSVPAGSIISAKVITAERHPISKLFSGLGWEN